MPPCTKITSATTTSFHHSQGNKALLAQHNIPTLPWSAVSPDTAPIEHIWDGIRHRLQARGHHQNLLALEAALVYEWNTLPQAFFIGL